MLVHCLLCHHCICFKQDNRYSSENESDITKFITIATEKKGNSDKQAFKFGIISCYSLEHVSIFLVPCNQDRQQHDALPSVTHAYIDSQDILTKKDLKYCSRVVVSLPKRGRWYVSLGREELWWGHTVWRSILYFLFQMAYLQYNVASCLSQFSFNIREHNNTNVVH